MEKISPPWREEEIGRNRVNGWKQLELGGRWVTRNGDQRIINTGIQRFALHMHDRTPDSTPKSHPKRAATSNIDTTPAAKTHRGKRAAPCNTPLQTPVAPLPVVVMVRKDSSLKPVVGYSRSA